MSLLDLCLIRSRGPSGEEVVRLGMPLVDDYLEFLAGRCRPNTVLAAAYDLKVFFTVVAKDVADVSPATCWGSSPPSGPVEPVSRCCSAWRRLERVVGIHSPQSDGEHPIMPPSGRAC
jgi:hypothetical protein